MTVASDQETIKCPFCDKKGLPILPVRYAVGRVDKTAKGKRPLPEPPILGAQFGQRVSDIPLPEDNARYTLRMLREGYLYVFNEKRGKWYAYVVTPEGYLYEFDFNDPSPPLPSDIEFSCTREGDDIIARCITVTDAHVAGRVWIGFSDVLWTDRVKQLHKKEEWRRKHMRCIDIEAWRSPSNSQPHVAAMTSIDQFVAEYSASAKGTSQMTPNSAVVSGVHQLEPITVFANRAFSFSPFGFFRLGDEAASLKQWAENAAQPYRPIVTALWDPQSILMELDHLMQERYREFVEDDAERQRKMAVSSAIMALREAICAEAEIEAMRTAQTNALNVSVYGTPNPGMAGHDGGALALGKLLAEKLGGAKVADRYKAMEDMYKTVSPVELDKARADAWENYEKRRGGGKRYDEGARAAFQEALNAELRKFDESVLTPLAIAHRDWMRSEITANIYDCNYDDTDERSGEVFTASVTLCVGNTQDKKICFDLYKAWLTGDPNDRRNLLLRALAMNRPAVLNEVKKAKDGGIDLWNLSWPSFIKAYGFSTERGDVIAHLIVGLGGPIAWAMSRVTDPAGKGLAVLLGLVSKRAIVPVELTGNRRDFRRHLIKAIRDGAAGAGQTIPSKKAMFDPVELELKRLEARGIRMSGTSTTTFFVAVDPNHIASMPDGLTKSQRCRWLAKSLRLSNELKLLDLPGGLRKVVNSNVRGGAVGGILDAILLWKLWSDADSTMSHKTNDSWMRIIGGIAGVIGGGAETIGAAMEGGLKLGLQYGRAMSSKITLLIKNTGRVLSVVGGVVVAIADTVEGVKEVRQGNLGIGTLYLLSAAAGAVLAVAAAFSATGVGIGAAIILLVVSALLAWLADNKIQDWLERSYWGTLSAEKYGSGDIEMAELQLAIKD